MKTNTMKSDFSSNRAAQLARIAMFASLAALTACSAFKEPVRPAVYDFGPPPAESAPPAADAADAKLPPIALADVDANQTLDSTAVLYRLAYANDQQLRPYALARWSATPADLVRQRLRERLTRQRPILAPLSSGADLTLRIELDEFSQVFDAPSKSVGLVRLTATLSKSGPSGDAPVAQRNIVVQRPATTPDAAGGVNALAAATDAAADDIAKWLKGLR